MGYAIDWIFLSPPKSDIETIPNVMLLGYRYFGKQLGREGRVLINETGDFIEETPQSLLIPSALSSYRKKMAIYEPDRKSSPHQTTNLLALWSRISQPPDCEK